MLRDTGDRLPSLVTILVLSLVATLAACAPRVPPPSTSDAGPHAARPASSAPARRPPVGVTTRVFQDAGRDRRLATTIWYPAVDGTDEHTIYWDGIFPGSGAWNVPLRPTPRRRPLVLLSHGSGGDGSNLAWLAEALASHGWIAAAVDHPGDRFGDTSREARLAAWRRPPDVTTVLTALLADPDLGPHLDARRVVAAGHSSGALTVLALAGARQQPKAFFDHCRRAGGPDCVVFDGMDPAMIPDIADAGKSYRDRRIRAVVALAPVLGPGVTSASLRTIALPVLLVASRTDELVPFERNAARYKRLIPRARLTTVPAAGHFVFMPVCNQPGRLIAANVCTDLAPEVDRGAVHARTTAEVIAFFEGALYPERRRRAQP
jgi:predicted dienelactone hydrolase